MPAWLNFLLGAVLTLAHVWVIISVLLSERRQPTATMAWLLVVLFLPLVGVLLYFFFGAARAKKVRQESRRVIDRIEELIELSEVHDQQLRFAQGKETESRTRSLLRLAKPLTNTPPSYGNKVNILVNGAATYHAMAEAIEAAKSTIHVEFYTIQPDRTGEALREQLMRKAREGVTVRVLCDHMGSISLPDDFWDELIEVGGACCSFNPVHRVMARFQVGDRVDFRNHRKIVIVDSRVGFTGGLNVGEEYLGLDPDVGHWRDTHLRIEGPAALALQEIFARDWLYAIEEDEKNSWDWFPEPPEASPGASLVQLVDSSPASSFSPMSQIYVHALAMAEERIWMTTPYFVPDEPLEKVLLSAALRGVEVRLLVPERADHMVTTYAGRSYYDTLLEAGARIYEYQKGFVHAKTLVIDCWLATVGSANMDMRSFLLNFELNAFVFDPEICSQLADHFLTDLKSAREITDTKMVIKGTVDRLKVQAARLAAPML